MNLSINSTANGSVVLGTNLTANYTNALVAGQWNVETANITNATLQPLFELGNGTSGSPSNAFTVLKNGNTTITGDAIVNGNATLGGSNTTTVTIPGNLTVNGTINGLAQQHYGAQLCWQTQPLAAIPPWPMAPFLPLQPMAI